MILDTQNENRLLVDFLTLSLSLRIYILLWIGNIYCELCNIWSV